MDLPITEEIVKFAVGSSKITKGVMEILIKQSKDIIITSEIALAAESNPYTGFGLTEMLLIK